MYQPKFLNLSSYEVVGLILTLNFVLFNAYQFPVEPNGYDFDNIYQSVLALWFVLRICSGLIVRFKLGRLLIPHLVPLNGGYTLLQTVLLHLIVLVPALLLLPKEIGVAILLMSGSIVHTTALLLSGGDKPGDKMAKHMMVFWGILITISVLGSWVLTAKYYPLLHFLNIIFGLVILHGLHLLSMGHSINKQMNKFQNK